MSAAAVISLILGLLRFANFLADLSVKNKWMTAGADAEIAKVSAEVLRKTQAGKAMMEKVDAMDEQGVDAGLRGLEPGRVRDHDGR